MKNINNPIIKRMLFGKRPHTTLRTRTGRGYTSLGIDPGVDVGRTLPSPKYT